MSTEFKWNHKDFEAMYQSCKGDDAVNITLQNIPSKKSRILEAGSGSGRVVKYLYDLGYKNIEGIELNREAVRQFNKKFPKIKVIQGDILDMPYKDETFDVIASYGVVEHFLPGLSEPLMAFKRVLKKNGVLIVSVPSMNIIRQLIYNFERFNDMIKLHRGSRRNTGQYYIYPQFGPFFEYRLKPEEFESACISAGYSLVASVPICHIDGLYHIFGTKLVNFKTWKFYPTKIGLTMNTLLAKFPFIHNHMHLCVLKKI